MYIEKFTKFLETVDLEDYRNKYLPIKIVEMDLPKNIQAIDLLYKIYWNQKKFVSFDAFYSEYEKEYRIELEKFRKKIQMCKKCFYKGLPARIYRTWASIITQIHAGYVAESVFGLGTTSMSAELDHSGADFQVQYKNIILNYQVKKETHSREVRKEKKTKLKIEGKFIDINYEVPSRDYFKEPKKKNGEYKLPYKRFMENQNLQRLSNGFVIFTKQQFIATKREVDSISK